MATQAEVDRVIAEAERQTREAKKTLRLWAKETATKPLAGPGERAVRSRPAGSPPAGAGAPPQSFPRPAAPSRLEFAVNLETAARGLAGVIGRPADDVRVMLLEEMDAAAKLGLDFDRALAEAKRKVLSDVQNGLR